LSRHKSDAKSRSTWKNLKLPDDAEQQITGRIARKTQRQTAFRNDFDSCFAKGRYPRACDLERQKGRAGKRRLT